MMELKKMLMEKIESIDSIQTLRSEISKIHLTLRRWRREIPSFESLSHNCNVKLYSESSR